MNQTQSRRLRRGARWTGSALLLAAVLPAAFSATGCRQRDVCEEVAGPCLAVRVTGAAEPGLYDELVTALSLEAASLRSGSTAGDITLPLTLRVVPPEGVRPSAVRGVRISGLHSGTELASAQTSGDFLWADDEHLTVTLELTAAANPDAGLPPVEDMAGSTDLAVRPGDMAVRPADLSGPPADMTVTPPPSLKWTPETNPGGLKPLYDVWIGSGTQVLAVGTGGLVLSRQPGGTWMPENSGTTSVLYSAFGIPGSGVWATGQNPGAWRRDTMGRWQPDQQGLMLGMDATLWSVTTGAAAGELWAGGEDGKVWHRQGSATANGMWTSEQALPAGIAVTSVAFADGAVFAVGKKGYASIRKDSAAMTPWQTPVQIAALNTLGLYGVWGFDRSTAVAVGSKGLLVRCTGGTWQTTTQTIDGSGNEFNGVWGTAASRVWAVGYSGIIVRVDGATATQLRNDSNQSLYGIFGRSDADIYVVGGGTGGSSLILHGQP